VGVDGVTKTVGPLSLLSASRKRESPSEAAMASDSNWQQGIRDALPPGRALMLQTK
jgi:hypothetical protein